MDIKNKNGFTIVEVVVVLGIAGLLFMIVFLAVPQITQQRRNQNRQEDIAVLAEAIERHAINNAGGTYPDAASDVVNDLNFNDLDLVDPISETTYSPTSNLMPDVGEYGYARNSGCGDNGIIDSTLGGGILSYAVNIGLEGGGAVCSEGS